MTKVSFKILSSMAVTLCSVAMFSVANADDNSMKDFELDITEDVTLEEPADDTLAIDDLLEAPPLEDLDEAPEVKAVEELEIAQAPENNAEAVTDALAMDPVEVDDADVLAAPAVEVAPAKAVEVEEVAPVADALPEADSPVANALPEPIVPAEEVAPAVEATPVVEAAPVVEAVPVETETPVVTKLPETKTAPIAQSNSIVENVIPETTVVPAPNAMPMPIQSQPLVPGTIAQNGNCRSCQNGMPMAMPYGGRQLIGYANPMPVNPYVVYPGPGRRGIIYDAQRNGVHAYPRRECPGCCRGNCGPMQDPYYTLRGPRDFDDPNPRPIGP